MRALRQAPPSGLGGALGFALLFALAAPMPVAAKEEALQRRVEWIQEHPLGVRLPPLDSIGRGDRTVASGERVGGAMAVAGGTLEMLGTIDGDAVAIDGDVVVREGGVVRGDVLAVGGRVRLEGGTIEGEMRSLSGVGAAGVVAPAADARSPFEATRSAVSLVLGWLMMLAIIGIGVLMFAGSHLAAVEEALTRRFSRAFWTGVLGQLAIAPVLLLLLVALAMTIIGILLIPFAVVAYTLLIAGLLTLGFLAVARRTGGALLRRDESAAAPDRRTHLRALMLGLVLYVGLWLLAALFTWSPLVAGALRGIAIVVTWAALTVGLGATLLTRAGTRGASARRETAAAPDELAWTTPTPVSGVAAARRPTPVSGRVREHR